MIAATADLSLFGLVALAFAVAGFVKGAVGMGLPTVAIALMTVILGLREAVAILCVPLVVTNLVQGLAGPHTGELLRRFGAMILAYGAAIWGGTVILFAVDQEVMLVALGCLLLVNSAASFRRPRFRVPARLEPWLTPAAGALAGLVGGATGAQGVVIAVYLQWLRLDKDRFVQGFGLVILVSALFLAAALLPRGALSGTVLAYGAVGSAAAMLFMPLGARLRALLPQEAFRKTILVMLALLGANLLRRALL